MAVSAKLYGLALQSAFNGEISWAADTIKVMLCGSGYIPDQDAHRYLSSVTNEAAGTGYTAGGATLANKTITYDGPSNTLKLDADDTVWTNSTITARYAVVYKATGTAATSPLLGYVDFGQDQSSVGAPFTIQWNTAGVITGTVA